MTTTDTPRAAALADTIMEQAQVYASAWSLIGGPFDHGNALETAEHEKAQLRTLVGDIVAPLDALQDSPASLEGLRRAILTPRAIVRDQDGMLSHPAVPYLDEDVNYETFFAAFGIDAAFIHMENDVDCDTYDQSFASNSANCSFWTPSAPAGDGWMLLEIYDTEDGPVALFVREKKPESMRERWKREKRESDAAAPSPADERASWGRAREPLAVAMAGFASRSGSRDFNAALSVLDAITEPGLPLSWLRSARVSAAETGATVGWAWISPTGHVSRFTADFDGKHNQLVQGWKVRPVAFCDSIANETVAEGADALAHEVWSAAQRAPGEGIEDAVQRIAAILSRSPAMAAEAVDWRELSRRLYVELFHCDQQMRSTRDEEGEPHWTQSAVVRDVLADAKAVLEAAPQPPAHETENGLNSQVLVNPPQEGSRLPALAPLELEDAAFPYSCDRR
ncbi:hypothetical protein WJ21_04560 [Burkholderia vietnamiensis]|uniref:hypothetical protein n=1 Tax=Burkholderia vietnamiensis TaxID=60552 RepID=UPI0007564E0D|nr:hypothetical protein [Burkholderia vietnamiensis]KVG03164.1 hypothetical protein WJ21_04560 [Burkholderia vietnamiensis]